MTSVLTYQSIADPFAAASANRFSSPPRTSASQPTGSAHSPHPAALFAHPQPTMPQPYRASTGPIPYSQQAHQRTDEFGSYAAGPSGAAQSRNRASQPPIAAAPTAMMAPPIPPHVEQTTAAASHATRQRNRQSHNPSATLGNASPPKPEYLDDAYVLHPSVYNYKAAHPRRPTVGFGPYVVLQTLGEGEFGKVKLGVHSEYGVEVAIKLIRRGSLEDEARASKVEREIAVLKILKHPNIVRMFDVIDTDKYIGIILEFAGGGELFDYILANKYLKERDASKLFAQLISGVDYLHKKHIVHRDLKLENLLLDKQRNIIITDFGFANRFEQEHDDLMATSCGSPCYAAPELVVSEGLYVGSAVDIWSCGVILYAMLAGYLPYDDDPDNPDGDNINLLYKYIMSTKLNFPEHVSPAAKHLLQIMLVPDPERRCRITDIMAHPWLAAHRDQFTLSIEAQEHMFQENMYEKSQAAKRELAQRRQVQKEAKSARNVFARSQSSVPGTAVTASMLEQAYRAREVKHHSALPGATTMPEYLNNAGRRTPIPHPPPVVPAVAQTSPIIADPTILSPIKFPISSSEEPSRRSSPAPVSAEPMVTVPSGQSAPTSIAAASTVAVENVSTSAVEPTMVSLAPSTPEKRTSPQRPPMSSNKNRHTIQVEYDGEASYERMKEAYEARNTAGASVATIPVPSSPTPGASPNKRVLALQASEDYDMDSASSQQSHTQEGTLESFTHDASEGVTPEATQILTPPAVTPPSSAIVGQKSEYEEPVAPSTPSRKGKETAKVASPSTPRARPSEPEDVVTPRAKAAASTPKAPISSINDAPRSAGKRFDSMPVKFSAPAPAQPRRPAEAAKPDLTPLGLPKPPGQRKDRSRKGMSLDKFGLAKLLGSVHASSSVDVSRPPPSAGLAARSIQESQNENLPNPKRSSQSRPMTADVDAKQEKKSKRKTLQAMVQRSNSVRSSRPSTAAAPLGARDMNPATPATPATASSSMSRGQQSPPMIIDSEGIQPTTVHDRGQSSASVVTVDALGAQMSSEDKNQASSSAAKKVMDWFRRKSMAKDTLVNLKTAGIRSDSQSSFVRVSHSPSRVVRETRITTADNTAAMSSTSSVGHDDAPQVASVVPVPDSATLPRDQTAMQAAAASTIPEPSAREPLASASHKTNIPSGPSVSSSNLPAGQRGSLPLPSSRSKSLAPDSATAHAASAFIPSKVPLGPNAPLPASRMTEDAKMRVHTGLVDQSALSSKPPKEVIVEVIRVLQEMGIEIKKENDYRLRCTRARKRKGGATTGLGLGSVMSVGSTMGSFGLGGSASVSRTDSRGLPMPSTPSGGILSSAGGLKGMLLRRGSSYSAHPAAMARSDSDILGSPSASTIGFGSPAVGSPSVVHEPLYGEHSIDSGDEVKFVVELCRIKNLPGLYLLNIKRLRGNVWSFKFIYQTILERSETLTH